MAAKKRKLDRRIITRACIDRVVSVNRLQRTAHLAVAENPRNQRDDDGAELTRRDLVHIARAVPRGMANLGGVPALRAVALKGNLWIPGRTLRVIFLDGDIPVQRKVEEVAHQWEEYADITFQFGNDPDSEIRISFRDDGSWSYVGTDAFTVPKSSPTMNFGWLTRDTPDDEYSRVVLHEFGHALGLIHEHVHPQGGIKWNKAVVYEALGGSPNYWSREEVDENMFKKYDENLTQFDKFDAKSIMMYSFPKEWTKDGFSAPLNSRLSAVDRRFIAKVYPK